MKPTLNLYDASQTRDASKLAPAKGSTMSADIDKDRAEFESMVRSYKTTLFPSEVDNPSADGSYRTSAARLGWEIWQAARATPSPAPAQQDSIFDALEVGKVVQARIKMGVGIYQDMRFMKWPHCLAPNRAKVDPEMVFDAIWKGRYWDCSAPGYGKFGGDNYGNGSIFVDGLDNVEVVEASPEASAPAGAAPTVKASQ